jgi:ABC-type multidrug transport system permease subunit
MKHSIPVLALFAGATIITFLLLGFRYVYHYWWINWAIAAGLALLLGGAIATITQANRPS